jgi:hypothetical protein
MLEVRGQLHPPATLHLEMSPRYPLERRLGGPRASLDDVEKRKMLTLPRFEFRPLVRPAHNYAIHALILIRIKCILTNVAVRVLRGSGSSGSSHFVGALW